MECLSYCIASRIDLVKLDHHYKQECPDSTSIKLREVLKVTFKTLPNVLLFIFKNGTVVTWGLKRYQLPSYLHTIRSFGDKPIPFPVHDEVIFLWGNKTAIEPHDYFDVDCLTLDQTVDEEELKLSLSYGFSQSVKLQYFEMILESLIETHAPLIQQLSKKGTKISQQHVRRVIGDILQAKTELNLVSNFMYHPKYFWQHPTLEEHYIMLERYLHIQRRVNAINHRLDTINDIFDMFNTYLENRHATHLEWIIIVLITIEVILSSLHFYLAL